MVFSSIEFLFYFLPLTFLLYFLSPKKLRNVILLALSLLFYAWGEFIHVFIMLGSILGNYLCGRALIKPDGEPSKLVLGIGITVNLLTLIFFKYAGFLVESLNGVLQLQGGYITPPEIALPLGISFFTFQAMSYLVDVYRKEVEPDKSLAAVALYISLFPQLIAGPIVRYKTVAEELKSRRLTVAATADGIRIFIIGLMLKVMIANTVAQPADLIFALPLEELTFSNAWLGAISYTFQIFFDFSGYSLMAIGLGKCFGFTFPQNFNYPYVSQSITEFWRRWHMSLSTWFRDYLYIPLGGNRKGPVRTYVNLFLVFVLCGMWHGASYTFLLWGIYHGLLLVVERLGLSAMLKKIWQPLRHIYALLAVIIGWVLFRADTLPQAIGVLKAMFIPGVGESVLPTSYYLNSELAIIFVLAVILSTPILDIFYRRAETVAAEKGKSDIIKTVTVLLCAFAMMFVSVKIMSGAYNPFIYFRF